VSDQGPSPLYFDERVENSNQEPAHATPPRKFGPLIRVVLETDDEEEEEEELIQIDNRRQVVHGVVRDLMQRVISESPPSDEILEETQRRTPVQDRLGVRSGGERNRNRSVVQRTPQRSDGFEPGTPVKDRLGVRSGGERNRNQSVVQRTPQRSEGLEPEEKSRRAPLNRRIGNTNTERTSAQENLSLQERLGNRTVSVFERMGDQPPVAANTRNRGSRSDRNSTRSRQAQRDQTPTTSRASREYIPRCAKDRAKAREKFKRDVGKPPRKEPNNLDIELVGFSFPAGEETTSDSE